MKFPYLPQIHGKRYNLFLCFYICDRFLLLKKTFDIFHTRGILLDLFTDNDNWQAKNKSDIDTDIKKSSKFPRPVGHNVKVCILCVCQVYKLNRWFSLNMCCHFMF